MIKAKNDFSGQRHALVRAQSEDQFWELIENSAADDPQINLDNLTALLSDLTVERFSDSITLDKHLEILRPESCARSHRLRRCSDDSFDYFRAWLISKGKNVYENALLNPDSLLGVLNEMNDNDFPENEEILYAALDAYEEVTGKEDFYDVLDSFDDDFQILEIELNWDEDDPKTLELICPKLFDRFFDDPL